MTDAVKDAAKESIKADIKKAAVLGGGSFGTVLANLLAENGVKTFLWMRNDDRAVEAQQKRENSQYLPGYPLHDNLTINSDLQTVLQDAEFVLVSVPSKSFRQVLQQAKAFISQSACVVSTTKGIEAGSFLLMSQIIQEELAGNPFGVISGPNLAKEIAEKHLAATVVASPDPQVCALTESLLRSGYFKLYSNSDLFGVELGGVLKNIYAIMAGMASSLGLGQNTTSMLMTRSLAEMSRFAVSMGANPMTFLGLAGVGDLIVTCSSSLSRNFRIGEAIGQGLTLEQAVEKIGQVAEGVNTLKLVKEKADEQKIYMPLANSLYEILFNGSTVAQEVEQLMSGALNDDVEFVLE